MKIGLRTIVCAFALGIGFTGCGLLDPDESSAPEVTLSVPPILDAGTTTPINGEVKASEEISSVIFTVVTAQNESVSESQIQVEGPTVKGVKSFKFKDSNLKIKISSNTPSGDYKIKVTVKADVENDTYFPFTVESDSTVPEGTPVQTATITAGANSNPDHGSSIDLDQGVAWLSADARNNISKIDLCYAYSGVNKVEKIGTPAWAKASAFDFAKNWTNPPQTKFYKITMTAAEFDAVTTKEEIPEFSESKATEVSSNVANGDVFIVKTTESAIALICITEKVPGSTGSIKIKLAK